MSAQTFPVQNIVYNGPPNQKVNFLILGDGYTSSQQTKFINDVTNIFSSYFNEAPFSTLKSKFNVYAVKVPSNVSGAAMSPSNLIDNYFGSTYGYNGIDRLLVPTKSSTVYSVANASFPQYDQIFVLVNHTKYGGAGGAFATLSMHSSAIELALHEAGHSYADLGDEYWYTGSERANRTANSNPNTIKWKSFLNQNGVGIYQYESPGTGWYRPHQNCKMRYLNSDFCKVCQNHITVVTNGLVGSSTPPAVPSGLYHTNVTSTSFRANWGAVATATGYDLLLWNGGQWALKGSTSNTTYNVTGLPAGSTQYWLVRAKNQAGTSNYSGYKTVSLQSGGAPPGVPTGLSTSNLTSNSFRGNWSAVSGATSYEVQLWQGSWVVKGTTASTYYNFAGLTGTNQYFRVRAKNSAGNSAYSSYKSVVLPTTTALSPPTGLNAQQILNYGFYAAWSTVTGATGYDVQIWNGSNWVVDGSSSTYYKWIYSNGKTGVYWRVRSKNASTTSPYSSYVYTAIPATPELTHMPGGILIYPNPTKDLVHISHHSSERITVELYSATGQLLENKEFDSNTVLDLKKYASGMYIVKTKIDGETFTQKIIKQ